MKYMEGIIYHQNIVGVIRFHYFSNLPESFATYMLTKEESNKNGNIEFTKVYY